MKSILFITIFKFSIKKTLTLVLKCDKMLIIVNITKEKDMDKLLSTKEVANALKIHPITLLRWRKDNKGPKCIKVGNVYKYPDKDLKKYINKYTKGEQI